MLKSWALRQPLVVRVICVIVVVAGLRIAALLHWIPPDWALSEDAVQDWIDRVVALVAAWSAYRKVTPTAAPRSDNGIPLVPVSSTRRSM